MGLYDSLTKCRRSKSPNFSHPDNLPSDLPPPDYKEAISTSSRSTSPLPNTFAVTKQLQIQAIGYDMNQAITGRKLENISIFGVESRQPEYTSVRLSASSNSCALVRASDARQTPIISTVYRFGPGRSPRMRILPYDTQVSVEEAIDDDDVRGERIEVKSRSIFSRAQIFDTSFGKLEWRYGTGAECAATNADSLLVLERVDRASLPDGSQSKSGARVAQLVRNDQYRTPGSAIYGGGNGGRLMMDMRVWEDDRNANVHNIEAFVAASCLLMLKKEADRFIENNMAAVV